MTHASTLRTLRWREDWARGSGYRLPLINILLRSEAKRGGCEDGFGAVGHLQGLENRRNMNFHGRLESSTRQIALLLLPRIIRASASNCRSVRPRSAADTRGFSDDAGLVCADMGVAGRGSSISGGM